MEWRVERIWANAMCCVTVLRCLYWGNAMDPWVCANSTQVPIQRSAWHRR